MGYSYNAGSSSNFPGLWPGTLFGYQPLATAFGQQPGMNAQQPFGFNDAFSMNGGFQQDPMAMMQQQLLTALMMQSMVQLLVDYFAQQLNAGAGSNNVGQMGGGNWGGGQRSGWGPRANAPGGRNTGGATRNRAGDDGHGHAHTDGPRSRGQRGIPDGLRPNAANGARVVRELGFDGTIGGIGQRAGRSDHPHGNAIDVMTHGDTAMGRRVAEHFRQNHDQLGVKYVIYQQQIASPRTGWRWEPMADRGSPTANHMDHPHISFH